MDDLNEELGVGELNATIEEIDTKNETSKELKRQRGPTIMFDVTRIRSLGDKKVVRYNKDGAPIGENEAKLKSFIGMRVQMKLMLIELKCGRKLELTNKDSTTTTKQVIHKIDDISMNIDSPSVNRYYSNDVLTQALGTKEHNGRVRVVGGYVTPKTYFHSVKKTSKDEANILVENEELRSIHYKLRALRVDTVMKYMREIVNRGSIVISDSIDIRKPYSQAELD
ncbi:putative serine/threonine-protein kinase nek2 [Cucumis melo var. makuwa]|uniref:Serine/threonine-protein kinase nek2 n=1 Tax=Cucumis melo var. makuwa TaxID=1194695 RepID=A0A5A7SXR7_CUCMM|nr:putative serine/threonine-protein kinase nek2 [Cucumis melo var. makuwa]